MARRGTPTIRPGLLAARRRGPSRGPRRGGRARPRAGGHAPWQVRQMVGPSWTSARRTCRVTSPTPLVESRRPPRTRGLAVEEFLGLDPGTAHESSAASAECKRVADDTPEADIVVLDDAALGFREQRDVWPRRSRRRAAAVDRSQMARPVGRGALWDHRSARTATADRRHDGERPAAHRGPDLAPALVGADRPGPGVGTGVQPARQRPVTVRPRGRVVRHGRRVPLVAPRRHGAGDGGSARERLFFDPPFIEAGGPMRIRAAWWATRRA